MLVPQEIYKVTYWIGDVEDGLADFGEAENGPMVIMVGVV